jgi:cell division protein FtsB
VPELDDRRPQAELGALAKKAELARLQQTQDQITQTVAELAEQNTRLVAAVELLRKRTRLLMGAVVVLVVALGALGLSGA